MLRVVWTRADTLSLSLVTLIGGFLRFFRLGIPDKLVFDEVYYAKDSCWYVKASLASCNFKEPPNEVHPPLGKWLIGTGIDLFGFDSFGWRVAAALAGTLTIALLYVLAKKLLRSTLAATGAAGLLALDFLHFVQSRTSMLDIFLPLFGVAAFLFLVFDRDRMQSHEHEGLLNRPWRLAAGVMAGAAVATKWSGGLLLATVILLTLIWEVASRRDACGEDVSLLARTSRALKRETLSIVVFLVLVPVAIYLGSYAGRFDGELLAAPAAEESWTQDFYAHHEYMYNFHRTLDSHHSYESPPLSWLALKRPVSYHFCTGGDRDCPEEAGPNDYSEVLATGNPFVWWSSVLALAYLAVVWARNRDFRRPEGAILAGFVFAYVPWLFLAGDRGAVFLFYLLPAVPFMCLALGYLTTRIGRYWEAKAAMGIFATGAILLFAFYYPIMAAVPIPKDDWDKRIWVFDNCEKPPSEDEDETLPPTGWCWI